MYCEVCIAAFRDRVDGFLELGSQISIAHHKTFQSFKNSSALGCVICHYLWRELVANTSFCKLVESWINTGLDQIPICTKVDPQDPESAERELLNYATNIFLWKADEDDDEPLRFQVKLNYRPTEAATSMSSSYDIFFLDPVTDKTNKYKVFGDSTSSESSLQKAKVWMQDCMSNHKACGKGNTGSWAPTRILDLDPYGGGGGNIRLIVPADECKDSLGPYASLSYIWGGQESMRLTSNNIASFRQGIEGTLLPKTFQEAIQVCQHFSIRYIWIDALCILQDSHEDWLSEAAKMDKVYAHSHLTIAAAASHNPAHGLFRNRDPVLVSPADNPISVDITSRGWCFQERLLSPRLLGFGQEQIYWECMQTSAVESGCPVRTWPKTSTSDLKALFRNPGDGVLLEMEDESKRDPYRLWGEIVEMYCKTRLTKQIDRLIALSGLAKAYSAYINDTYVGGMWKKSLETELMWSKEHDIGELTTSADYIAPSFFWASASLPCNLTIEPEVKLRLPVMFKVLDLQLIYATEDTTGGLTGGHIDLSGTVVEVRLSAGAYKGWDTIKLLDRTGEPIQSSTGRSTDVYFFLPDRMLKVDVEEEKTRRFYVFLGYQFLTYNDAASGVSWEAADSKPARRAERNCSWILLEAVPNQQGVYRRLGMVHTYQDFLEKDGEEFGASRHVINLGTLGDEVPNRGRDGDKYIIRIV
ncbi:uncharacterized protein PgNI_04412 [Pyricularia grisea]|uniref:Heterokaryon incompatibility domain-containing protein n=1 Tax=Pyricularia grisea TaxID=148305 RepID=A0A6P8BEY3_PYRGI|nr:uncharacterized protein PgNI_04412 [Pyricularia grisea]TLD14262.1 hypothetical protein PgNI_04412 [Pyricularia grisea]